MTTINKKVVAMNQLSYLLKSQSLKYSITYIQDTGSICLWVFWLYEYH